MSCPRPSLTPPLGLLLLVALSGPSHAQAVYVPSAYTAGFGDGLHIDKYKAGYYRAYQDNDNHDGLEYSQHHFVHGPWRTRGEQVAYMLRSRDAEGNVSNAALGYNQLNGSASLWTADANVLRKLGDSTTGEISFNRDRVEVRQSLQSNVFASTYALNVEQTMMPSVRALFSVGETRYSDGNHRPTTKLKATYDVLPEYGLSLQVRSRYFKNTDTTVHSGYYNPARFVENIAAVEINRSVQGWNLSGNVGWGRQAGGNDPKTLARAYEVSATTPIAQQVFVRLKAGYFRSLGYNAPDFLFRYASEELILVF